MKKFFLRNWPILVLLALSGLIVWPVFLPGYFSHHDDLQVMRIFEMRKCFNDFQLPCRWVPDMGYGNGYPLFNFYGPLPYYVGAVASYFLGYIGSAKLLFFLPLVFGGVFMYILAKELFGELPGFVSAVLFLFAPYRALDSFVRGAIGESFAIALIPLVFYLFLKLVKTGNKKYFIGATLLEAIFLVSHNIMTLIFTPFLLLWIFYWLYETKWQKLKLTSLSLILSFCLAAFFILPAYFEKNLVQTEGLTRAELNFRAQFVKVGQLFFDRSWYYSGSQPQAFRTISYQIGWPHWWLVILASLTAFLVKKKDRSFVAFILFFFVFSVFMTHNRSAVIWEKINILVFVQFPWRFLSIAIFSASLLGGYLVSVFKGKVMVALALLITLITVLLNWSYFRPEHFYPNVTDKVKLSGNEWLNQQKGALLDYLPKTALEPREPAPTTPYAVRDMAKITNFANKSDRWEFRVSSEEVTTVEVPVFDFPGWTTFVNGVPYQHSNKNILGRISVSLPKGEFKVSGKFMDTKIRAFSNTLSISGLLALLLLIRYGKDTNLFS